jgi:hypothetical protein
MKTFSSATLLALATSSALALACSSSSDTPPVTVTDTGTETTAETTPTETGADTKDSTPATETDGGALCDLDLPTGFACKAPTKTAGATTCSEAVLQDFLDKCVTADFKVPAACADWRAANAACNTCILAWIIDPTVDDTKVYPDSYKCYWSLFDATCAKAVNCSYDCQTAVCDSCDGTAGSGADGKASEYDDCVARAIAASPKGKCYDLAAKDADACFTKTDTSICDNNEYYYPSGTGGSADLAKLRQGTIEFYRGACRDGGDWKNATSAVSGDAGASDAADGG